MTRLDIKKIAPNTATNPQVIPFINPDHDFYDPHNSNQKKDKALREIHEMLHDVVRYGTARSINHLQKDYNIYLGGKTGTTNHSQDALFVGYVRDLNEKSRWYPMLVVGVFVGYSMPKSLGEGATGGKVALPIFGELLHELFKKD